MEDDYFLEMNGETVTAQQNTSQLHSNNQEPFQFNDFNDSTNYHQMNDHVPNTTYGSISYTDPLQQNQNLKKVRQEQERISQMLRQKSNQQYEQKQKKKEAGRRQLQEFLEKKQDEKRQRKQDNLKKEQQKRTQLKKVNQTAGWRKVITNVPLKQGQHPGSKDTNRMREAILHKRQDLDQE